MSDNLIVTLLLLLLALVALFLTVKISTNSQSSVDGSGNAVTTVNIPFLGEISTTSSSLVLAFFGVGFAVLAYLLIDKPTEKLIVFDGNVIVDKGSVKNGQMIMIGISSSEWREIFTGNAKGEKKSVRISVPDNWNAYNAFAFTTNDGSSKIDWQGAQKSDRKFELRIRK